MKWKTIVRWFAQPFDEWRQRRAVRRETDRRLAAWRSLPEDEAVKWVHPASPTKPEGWSLEEYKANQRRQRGPAN
jgi:hypothetical protein